MPTLLIDTTNVLGGDALPICDSRSLRLTRYASPELKEKPRQAYLAKVVSSPRHDEALKSWHTWLTSTAQPTLIQARLEARLLINMAGSVLENAGLNIDRYGTAYIPGSAVKACARRAALAALHQWCETNEKTTTSDDVLTPACASFTAPSDLLFAILRVFGCTDLEWQDFDTEDNDGNDLAWACAKQWPTLRDTTRAALNATTGNTDEAKPTRRGTVAFLPAYPNKRPLADLELDVLTSHHQKYYSGDLPIATDTENPIPVYFPAVAARAEYTFALLPVGHLDATLLGHAKSWLTTGLTVFGLGAKTAAGYGYFTDITQETTETQIKENARIKAAADEAAAKARQEAELIARKASNAARAAMTPEQRAEAELAEKAAGNAGTFKRHLLDFRKHTPDAQAAIVRWLATPAATTHWSEIKQSKKEWASVVPEIHRIKNLLKIKLP